MAKVRSNGTDVDHQNGDNVTDELRRDWYRRATMAKIGVESAQALVKSKNAEFTSVLKSAKKAGVDAEAIKRVLKVRFQDEEDLIRSYREELKTLDLSGVISNIKEKLLDRLDIEEPTANEEAQISQDRAFDMGARDYHSNIDRSENKFIQGTTLAVAWDRGWFAAQAVTASEMKAEPPAAVQ